jgi:hypothetical protein
LWLERSIQSGWINCTPYVYDEIFYDARYDRWAPNHYAAGVQFPVRRRVVLEPYYQRQISEPSPPRRRGVLGFKLGLFF